MEPSIYRYIWRHSKRQQLIVLFFTLATFPILYFSLEVPKLIVNEALGTTLFPREVGGIEFGQTGFLLLLCCTYLALVIAGGAIKMHVNIFKGTIAERLIRRLRYQLIDRILRFPRGQFQKISEGELIPIVTAEVEPLGGLMGDALAQPLLQSGQMLTVLAFLFVQNPWLGLSAVVLIPLQAWVIPRLQRQVNLLHREKVKRVRTLSARLAETVGGIQDIHLSGATQYTRAAFSSRLGAVYRVRLGIFRKKFFMKFINNFINSLTPFFFYAVGGFLVLQGDLTLGALVAALSAHKDLVSPWKELLNFYNQFMDSSIRYETIIEKFHPPGLIPSKRQTDEPTSLPRLNEAIELTNVRWSAGRLATLRDVSMRIEGGALVAVTGPDDIGREKLAQLLSRTLVPNSGHITIGGRDLATLPDAITGARIAYAGPDCHVFSGTIGDNVELALKRVPPRDFALTPELEAEIDEALAAGNCPYPYDVDWVDYRSNGFRDKDTFDDWWLKLVEAVQASDFVFDRGLFVVIDPAHHPKLAEGVVRARSEVAARLAGTPSLETSVHRFDPERYNPHASIAENLLFGEPTDARLTVENLPKEPYVRQVIEACGLAATLETIGLALVERVAELAHGLSPAHPFFDRYEFVDESFAAALPDLRLRAAAGFGALEREERERIMRAVFMLTPKRHHLGLVDEASQQAIVEARHYFSAHLPTRLSDAVAPFDADVYLPNTDIITNSLMGRVAATVTGAEKQVREIVKSALEARGLRRHIELLVADTPAGIGGSALAIPARERVTVIRALCKRPDVVVLHQALASFREEQRAAMLRDIRALLPESTLIWLDRWVPPGIAFDQVFEIAEGRVATVGETAGAPALTEPEGEHAGPVVEDLDLIAVTPLFSALTPVDIARVAANSDRRTVEAGEMLFERGERPDGIYTILDGEIELIDPAGDNRVVARVGRGDTVGALGVFGESDRAFSARAATAGTLLFTRAEDVLALLSHGSGVANSMLRYLGRRVAAFAPAHPGL